MLRQKLFCAAALFCTADAAPRRPVDSCAAVRISLLYDGRCLTADRELSSCGVSLAPCAYAGEANATLQSWRLSRSERHEYTVVSTAREGITLPGSNCIDQSPDCAAWAQVGECTVNPAYMMHVRLDAAA